MNDLTKIEICWDGPMTIEDVKKKYGNSDKDFGIYQIYGTHNISGPNTLLYIGKVAQQTFSERLSQHQRNWLETEYSDVQLYIGRLGGTKNINDEEWSKQIDNAESLLIYHCAPP